MSGDQVKIGSTELTPLKEDDGPLTPLKDEEKKEEDEEGIHLKKQISLIEGVAIIIGIIIGSGIFISPKGVIKEVGSIGMSLTVWVICGFMSMVGALCYAELGTSIPKSGADYAYIHEAFGGLLSFLYLWDANFIFVPVTNAIMGLTVANYLVSPFFLDCQIPDIALRLIAAVCIMGLTYLNCYSTKVTTKLQTAFMFTKLFALIAVIIIGIVAIFTHDGLSKFEKPFENTTTDFGKIAVSFYSGIYSYAGWNYLNFMTEELRNPFQNLPRAIYISLPLVTVIYTLANIAYLTVLSPVEMIASDAIAVTFAEKIIGAGSVIFPILVAFSALGSLSCHIMTSSRLCFVGARKGHFPDALSLITLDRLTPKPALIFLGVLSLLYLLVGDIFTLIEYSSFVESFFILVSVSGLLYLRWKCPEIERPIKINIFIPIFFLVICTFLVCMPIIERPKEVGMGILITICGIPVYFLGVYWKNKPEAFQSFLRWATRNSQILFLAVKED